MNRPMFFLSWYLAGGTGNPSCLAVIPVALPSQPGGTVRWALAHPCPDFILPPPYTIVWLGGGPMHLGPCWAQICCWAVPWISHQ